MTVANAGILARYILGDPILSQRSATIAEMPIPRGELNATYIVDWIDLEGKQHSRAFRTIAEVGQYMIDLEAADDKREFILAGPDWVEKEF